MGLPSVFNVAGNTYVEAGLRPENVPTPLPDHLVSQTEKELAAASRESEKQERALRDELARVQESQSVKAHLTEKLRAEQRLLTVEERQAIGREAAGEATSKAVRAVQARLASVQQELIEAERAATVLGEQRVDLETRIAAHVHERDVISRAGAVARLDRDMAKHAARARQLYEELVHELQEVRRLERVATEQHGAPPIQRLFGQQIARAVDMAMSGGQCDPPDLCWQIR